MRLKTKAKPVQYRKICLVNTVHIPGDGHRFHYRGIAVPDIKNVMSFVIIRANQVSVDRDMVTQQSVGHQAFTTTKVFP
ncbi:hypothetical protein BvCmsHHNP029_04675 [Escherichia coli]|nr:hypothetical protein BvCmsHHNP029_04675 [Escherichia coli]